jgi:hypothetical protein
MQQNTTSLTKDAKDAKGYICDLCKFSSINKNNYNKHLLTQKHIGIFNKHIILKNNTNSFKQFNCECGKQYKSKQGLWKHKKQCNQIKTKTEPDLNQNIDYIDTDKETLIEIFLKKEKQFEKEKEELQKQVEFEKQNKTIETQNNDYLNIQINAFGCETLEHITDAFKVKCLKQIYKSIPEMVIKIHFNTKYPENHNVKIPNKKLPHASIMTKDNTWKTVDKKNTISSMVDKSFNILDDTYEEHKGELTETKRNYYEKYQEKYWNNDKTLHKQLTNDVECLVLDGTR